MAYCYECGEQVADNDTFCPYCGISIEPVALADDKENAAFDKTVAVQMPPVAEAQSAPSEPPAFSVKSDETPLEEKSLTDDSQNSPPNFEEDAEDWAMPPTPKILATENHFAGTSPAAKDSAQLVDDKSAESPISDSPAGRPIGGLDVQFDFALKEEKRAEADDYSAGSGVSSAAQSNNFDIDDFDSKPDADYFPVREDAAENLDNPAEKTEDAPVIDDYPIARQPIAMPEDELPSADAPPSKFDSVSLLEKKESVEEKPEEFAPSVSVSEPEKSAAISEGLKEPHSYTSPIASTGDTGGQGKAKLKPLDEGTVLNNRYEIIRKIGGGGMGAVYLASDKNLGGVLRAVKEMVQSYIEDAQQEKAVNDFKRESLLLTSLDHQSIPTIYDYFFDDQEHRFYLVMKYISGGDLAGRLRSAPESRIDEREVTQWAIQIADVLDYLHNRQPPIVYRDLKPANIMVDGNSGRVMLIDFGIARWVNKEEKGVTAVGTMGYAPPELFSGNVEARSDIYSLGSTMFHLLTGADPQSNPLLIFDFQKHPRPRQINPQLSDQMERILMRAVEYNAEKRFTSAAELRKSLEDHLDSFKANRVTYGVKEPPAPVALSDQPVFCGFCGQKIVATDMFCAFCGSKQPLAQQGVHSESYSPVPLTAQLLIIGTNDLEQPAFRLEKEDNLVGRRDPMSNIFPEVDLSKYDPQTKISRRHARIWRKGSEFMVEDLGSSNGTYILPVVSDTMRLQPHQPQLLTNGDKLRLGDTTLHFILG